MGYPVNLKLHLFEGFFLKNLNDINLKKINEILTKLKRLIFIQFNLKLTR
jgi:hypothetical protein